MTIPNRWQTARIDLGAYAGKSIVMQFALASETERACGAIGAPRLCEATSLPRLMAASKSGQRKPRGVIFLVTDTLRKDHLNIYGYQRETLVNLKKFADEGVAFSHAISQATMTKISVPSIVTSLYPLSHTVLSSTMVCRHRPRRSRKFFATRAMPRWLLSVPFTGKSNNMHQGYDELHETASISDNELRSKNGAPLCRPSDCLAQEHRDVPFFVFLHVFDPHSPFRPRPPYDTLWGAPGAKDRLAELEADMRRKSSRRHGQYAEQGGLR